MAYYPPAVGSWQSPQMQFPQQMGNYPSVMQNAPTEQQTGQQGFSVRPVASREEAMAVQTDFFGPGILMPCLGQGVIFLKRFNQNTGASDLLEFVYAPPKPPRQETDFVPMDLFRQLAGKVEQLEKGMVTNVPDE